jgi:hypothetical protein
MEQVQPFKQSTEDKKEKGKNLFQGALEKMF